MSNSANRTVPQHVAIIMDGNGRWANARGLPRTLGHRKGVEVVRDTVKTAREAGIGYLTLFAFSSENWRRPEAEISELFGLLKAFVRRDLAELHRADIRIRVIGDRASLQPDIRDLLLEAEQRTASNGGMTLVIAFNYGARDEIARAAVRLAVDVREGRLDPASIDAEMINENLDTVGLPDPDLIIRTSGEERLSNFLLWQAAYSELMFVPEFWPDFTAELFHSVLDRYAARERRFGGLSTKPMAAVGS